MSILFIYLEWLLGIGQENSTVKIFRNLKSQWNRYLSIKGKDIFQETEQIISGKVIDNFQEKEHVTFRKRNRYLSEEVTGTFLEKE